MSVNPDEYTKWEKRTKFYHNAMTSLVKSVAFRSMAITARDSGERVSAAVTGYYSLLHLAICLMYLLPQLLPPKLLGKLVAESKGGTEDPSKAIHHNDAIAFLRSCAKEGLDRELATQIECAKALREFVNYGPRAQFADNTIVFGKYGFPHCSCDCLIDRISGLIERTLIWALGYPCEDVDLLRMALSQCSDFFARPDLFYLKWCSAKTVQSSKEFVDQLVARCSSALNSVSVRE